MAINVLNLFSKTSLSVYLRAFFSRFSANTGKFIFRNLEFRQQILEFRKKSLNFHGEILRKPLSLDEKP